MKKDKIITLVIGILIGAVVTAAIFLIFKPKDSRKVPDFSQFNKDGDFDPSNFKPGEGRNRRNKDSDSEKDSKVEEKETEDKQDENKG